MDNISMWANICESLDEEKRLEKAMKKSIDDNKEEEKNETSPSDVELKESTDARKDNIDEYISEEKEDDIDSMSDDELMKRFDDRKGGEPSYDDVLKLAEINKTNKDDIISKEDYEQYSDEDKQRLHASVMILTQTPEPNMSEYPKLATTNPEEFMKASDEYLNSFMDKSMSEDPEYINIHNQMTELYNKGLKSKENARKYNYLAKKLLRLMKSGNSGDKITYVFSAEVVYHPSNRVKKSPNKSIANKNEIKHNGEKSDIAQAKAFYANIVPGEYELGKQETRGFANLDDAKSFVAKRVREINEKYHVSEDDWDTISIKKEQKISKDKTDMVSGLPAQILDEDPNAIGFCFSDSRGEGKHDIKGADKYYDKTESVMFFEYFIYQSSKGRLIGGDGTEEFLTSMTDQVAQ